MSMTYLCGSSSNLIDIEVRKILVNKVGLTVTKESSLWISNRAVTVMIYDYVRNKPLLSEIELAGFSPKWRVDMELHSGIGESDLELGFRTIVRVADCILDQTTEDFYFSSAWERLLISRRSGSVTVREGIGHYLAESYLSHLSMPYTVEKMQP